MAARLGRTATIAAAFFTALVGIVGTVTAATVSYWAGVTQQASENERSATEFLRKQRQEAYAAFGSEVNNTFIALRESADKLSPSNPPPTLEVFNELDRDQMSHFEKLNAAETDLTLVASQDVCDAAVLQRTALDDAEALHIEAARPYVEGQKPPDDDYRKISITYEELEAIQIVFTDFIRAAREDVTDLALRQPAKNCP